MEKEKEEYLKGFPEEFEVQVCIKTDLSQTASVTMSRRVRGYLLRTVRREIEMKKRVTNQMDLKIDFDSNFLLLYISNSISGENIFLQPILFDVYMKLRLVDDGINNEDTRRAKVFSEINNRCSEFVDTSKSLGVLTK